MQRNCQNCVNYIFLINYVVLMCYYLLLIQKVNKCCKKRLLWRYKKIKQKKVPKKPWGQRRFSKTISRILCRPNSVSCRRFRYQTNWVASIINLQMMLPPNVKPPTRFRFGTNHWKPIWGCCTQRLPVSLKPLPICFVTVALIVRSLCLVN